MIKRKQKLRTLTKVNNYLSILIDSASEIKITHSNVTKRNEKQAMLNESKSEHSAFSKN